MNRASQRRRETIVKLFRGEFGDVPSGSRDRQFYHFGETMSRGPAGGGRRETKSVAFMGQDRPEERQGLCRRGASTADAVESASSSPGASGPPPNADSSQKVLARDQHALSISALQQNQRGRWQEVQSARDPYARAGAIWEDAPHGSEPRPPDSNSRSPLLLSFRHATAHTQDGRRACTRRTLSLSKTGIG